jgi:hypothetical protein
MNELKCCKRCKKSFYSNEKNKKHCDECQIERSKKEFPSYITSSGKKILLDFDPYSDRKRWLLFIEKNKNI